jgi:6-phosphofructokinase 1
MLGSALGVGAFRALIEDGRDEVMVSTMGQLALRFVPFAELIDPDTMMTKTRFIEYGSDFHKLARFLETYIV